LSHLNNLAFSEPVIRPEKAQSQAPGKRLTTPSQGACENIPQRNVRAQAQHRDRAVNVRLSKQELGVVAKAARQERISMSAVVRRAVMRAPA
jgi:hypothetical protein